MFGEHPAVTVAVEYRRLSWARRMVLRWVSPDMARAARDLTHQQQVVAVQVAPREKSAFARWADKNLSALD